MLLSMGVLCFSQSVSESGTVNLSFKFELGWKTTIGRVYFV